MVVDMDEIPVIASAAALDAMAESMKEGVEWQMLLR